MTWGQRFSFAIGGLMLGGLALRLALSVARAHTGL